MKAGLFQRDFFRQPVQVFAALAGSLAVFVLMSWGLHDWKLLAFGPNFVPMAPSSAWLMLLVSGSAFVHNRWPTRAFANTVARSAAMGAVLVSLLVGAKWLIGFGLPADAWLTSTTERVGEVPVGRMSPLTAAAFLLAALAAGLEVPPLSRRWLCRQIASLLALATLSLSLVVALSYAAGVPLLYGRATTPMALLTAISFIPLGLGVLAAAGTDTVPLALLPAAPDVPSTMRPRSLIAGPLWIFLCLSAGIGAVGYRYFRHQVTVALMAAENELSAVADLKVQQIRDWRSERLRDAEQVMREPFASRHLEHFLTDPAHSADRSLLSAWLGSIREHNEGLRALLVDRQMIVRLASPADKTYFGPIAQTFALEAMRPAKWCFPICTAAGSRATSTSTS